MKRPPVGAYDPYIATASPGGKPSTKPRFRILMSKSLWKAWENAIGPSTMTLILAVAVTGEDLHQPIQSRSPIRSRRDQPCREVCTLDAPYKHAFQDGPELRRCGPRPHRPSTRAHQDRLLSTELDSGRQPNTHGAGSSPALRTSEDAPGVAA